MNNSQWIFVQSTATILTFFSLRRLSSSWRCRTHGNFYRRQNFTRNNFKVWKVRQENDVLTFIKQLWVVTIHGREILTEDCVLKMWKSLFVSYFEWFSNFNFSQKKTFLYSQRIFLTFSSTFWYFFLLIFFLLNEESQSDYLLWAFLLFFFFLLLYENLLFMQ